MIVVEGPDGAGKTSLIKLLNQVYDIPIAPRVVSKDTEAMVDLQKWVDDDLDKGFQRVIYDRYRLISEPIYGPILRNKSEAGFDKLSWLAPRLKRFYDLKPTIIYCLPPLETVLSNIDGDTDNIAVALRIRSIYSAYVAKAAADYSFAQTTIHVWDYVNSPTIKGYPIWANTLGNKYLPERQNL